MRRSLIVPVLLLAGCGVHGDHHVDLDAGTDGAGPELELDRRFATTERREPSVVAADSGRSFSVAVRRDEMVQFPCERCHRDGDVATEEPLPERAHWQIDRPHGVAGDLTCQTCHPADRPGSLRDVHGREIEFDHSYQLCGACHFEQLDDWANGAHGKRLAGWSGERVVLSCAGCHDPHDPGFETRLPSISFTVPEAGR